MNNEEYCCSGMNNEEYCCSGMNNEEYCCSGMKNTVVVELSPDKPNIFLSVEEVDGVKGAFLPVVERLKNLRTGMGRIIILCQTRDKCPMLYSFLFLFCLGKEFTEPPGMPPQLP